MLLLALLARLVQSVGGDAPPTDRSWMRRLSTKRMSRASLVNPLLLRPDVFLDKCDAITQDSALQFVTVAYYRPGALHFNVVDLTLLLYVSLIAIGWGEADSVGAAAGQALLIAAGVSVVLSSLWVVRPQKPEEKYQSVVDAMVLVMAVVQAVVNALNTAVRLKYALSGRSARHRTQLTAPCCRPPPPRLTHWWPRFRPCATSPLPVPCCC